mmetsp:Transcript_101213/g.315426  ORF Transcript_101213/g.315426 Transcript_101213/m.315426 type:complete len:177 (-) Transcript_101213:29-559(-)|eukprot:CAMPEP_0204572608 /NCGR_PEP_ID=MMETSP0661-20131031/39561_1 /ASSEMBLY_ACC=CAM_ASM_000606 /TAXON_ID=109239 /ORGANISM="Alexandrium margalefi, Strain AMGDE01CS-322" /LENGTH=176 /DNA_ID=CAMNT_0051580973 /DNA_START=51 /DNA_END=581 /DNA_ORIENTATION=-
MPLELRSVNHLALQTSDVRRLSRFYTELLGFVPLERPIDGLFRGVWLWGGGIQLHIMNHDAYEAIQGKLRRAGVKDAPGFQGAPREPLSDKIPQRSVDGRIVFEDHLAFACPDMGKVREQLRSLGIPFHDARSEREDHLWILDPDGRTIELTEDAQPPPLRPEEKHQKMLQEFSRL